MCRGISSTVRRCLEKATQIEFAVKMIDLTQEKDNDDLTEQLRESTKKEMEVLRIGSAHPNISKNNSVIRFVVFTGLGFVRRHTGAPTRTHPV